MRTRRSTDLVPPAPMALPSACGDVSAVRDTCVRAGVAVPPDSLDGRIGSNEASRRVPRLNVNPAAPTAGSRALYADVPHRLARSVPYVSLWYKTTVAVFHPSIEGVRLPPTARFALLAGVVRAGV